MVVKVMKHGAHRDILSACNTLQPRAGLKNILTLLHHPQKS